MATEIELVATSLNEIKASDAEVSFEFWFARDLMSVLDYSTWESFSKVVGKAQESCRVAGVSEDNHFRQATKKVRIGSTATRNIEDVMLSRFACYLVAQNGDPSKRPVAIAQAYFAAQTQRVEELEERAENLQRLEARDQLKVTEKQLSESFAAHGISDPKSYGIIRSKGDRAFFGGNTTKQMKEAYGVASSKPLGDFLPTITLAAKTLINEMSKLNIDKSNIQGESAISVEHVANSTSVRNMLGERGIRPENLPAEEDINRVERRHAREQGKLRNSRLPSELES